MALFSEIGNSKYGNWIVYVVNEKFILFLIKYFRFILLEAENEITKIYYCVTVQYIVHSMIAIYSCTPLIEFYRKLSRDVNIFIHFGINRLFEWKWDSISRAWLSFQQWIITILWTPTLEHYFDKNIPLITSIYR